MDNPSNYFTSNTTVVFPPGYHEVSTEGQLVIQNVNNISLVGDNNGSTKIKCTGQFSLAFINITNLTVSKLSFSMCGAPMSNASQLAVNLNELIYVFDITTSSFRIASLFPSMFSIYLLLITTFTANNLNISHSRGMGLLGVNIFGVSSIQQAVFVKNAPNCAIVFLDSYSPIVTPVLYITDSSFVFGTMSDCDSSFNSIVNYDIAAGLSIIGIPTTYYAKSYIRNVTVYGNSGSILGGNMLLRISCKVAIQVTQLNCTGEHLYGLVLKMNEHSTNSNSFDFTFYMSHSYFGRNSIGASLHFDSIASSVWVKLENITAENTRTQALQVLMNHSSILILKNVNFNSNAGALLVEPLKDYLDSFYIKVEFYGSNIFADNNDKYSVLNLRNCNVTFYGNTSLLHNKGKCGGALSAKDVQINFQGSVVFQENEGEYGGALMLYQNVSVVIGHVGEVRFVRNHAQISGGAVYARRSRIIIRAEQKLSFVENEGYDGGAITLTSGSIVYLEVNSSVTFVRNHASHYGGAIYYVDDYTEDFELEAELSTCFYGILSAEVLDDDGFLKDISNYIKLTHTSLEFYNNTAGFAGSALYGGWVDLCKMYINYQLIFYYYGADRYQFSVFDSLSHFHQPTQLSLISSNPTRVCVCTNMSIPDCSITEQNKG